MSYLPFFSQSEACTFVELFYCYDIRERRIVTKQNQEDACVSQVMQLSVQKQTELFFYRFSCVWASKVTIAKLCSLVLYQAFA